MVWCRHNTNTPLRDEAENGTLVATEPNRTEPNRTEPLLTDSPRERGPVFRLTPILAALLLVYPVMQAQRAQAEDAPATALPDLGRPKESSGIVTAGPNGASFDNRFDGKRLLVSPEYSQQTGLSLTGAFAFPLSGSAAGGLLATVGGKKQELLFNAGFQMDEVQRLVLTAGQLRQHLDIGFISGNESVSMTQNSGAVSYQRFLGQGLLNSFEVNGYLADTGSRDLADKTYAIDTATLYELWNDPRRVAGGRVTGLQGKVALTPVPGGTLRLGLGGERLEYDYLTGKQSTTRATGSAEWTQQLAPGLNLKAGLDGAAAQNRLTLGVERAFSDGWKFGINATAIQGRDGAPNDSRLNLTWTYDFGGKGGKTAAAGPSATPAWGSLLDQVAKRPAFLPVQVVAKLDPTATPTRLIAVNKGALPAGSSVNTTTGIITTPLGVAVTGIAGVTLNAAPFANSGQFSLSGNSLVIDPGKITQPTVGVTDTYVVTVNNFGGGTTLVTVLVSHGSVKIDSISVNGNAAPTVNNFTYGTNIDNVAKTFSWLALSAAADGDGDTLTATVATQGAKGSCAVAGNNVTYTPASGKTGSDTCGLRISDGHGNNKDITVTVQNIDTYAAPPTGLAFVEGALSTNASINIAPGLTPGADTASWFVQWDSATAPASGAGGWSPTQSTTGTIPNFGSHTMYIFAKDALGNVSAPVSRSIVYDLSPTIPSIPVLGIGISGGTTVAGLSATFADEQAWGGSSAISITANNGATITGGPFGGSYGAKTFGLTMPAWTGSPITITITYSVTDSNGLTTTVTDTVDTMP